MVEINDLKLDTSIGTLYALRNARGHKTLQETYHYLTHADMDVMMDVLRIAHNKATNKEYSYDEFIDLLSQKSIGFIRITKLFAEFVEHFMYSGLSPEEIADAKKLAETQSKK